MRLNRVRFWLLPAALPVLATMAFAQEFEPRGVPSAASPQAMTEYRRRLRDYTLAWQSFESRGHGLLERDHREAADAADQAAQRAGDHARRLCVDTTSGLWRSAAAVRSCARLTAPPIARDTKYVPTIPEMLASAQKYFQFAPQRASEIEFKRAYAKAVATEGVPRDLAVRLYAFETGGIGTYDVQSGLLNARPGAKPLSAALGYNQLLITYTLHLLADQGEDFVRALQAKAAGLGGDQREAMLAKIAVLKRMIAFSRTVPANWNAQEKLGETPQGWGVHPLLLDIDVGPLLQARKLNGSLRYPRTYGYREPLTAAELQMMNLMGDGSGSTSSPCRGRCAIRCRRRISSSAAATSATPSPAATTPWRNCWLSPMRAWTPPCSSRAQGSSRRVFEASAPHVELWRLICWTSKTGR